jgi:hypothetical protein
LYSVTIHKLGKLNQLAQLLPEGLLVDATWMEKHSYSRALRSQYVANGWLVQPVRSTYCRPRGPLSWEQVVISLQTLLHYPVSVGGRTALDQQGYTHYLYHQQQLPVHLYTDAKLPAWLSKLPNMPEFIIHNRSRLLPEVIDYRDRLTLDINYTEEPKLSLPGSLKIDPWGQWHWPLVISTPERAILEVIDDIPNRISFDMVDKFLEGLLILRPRQMQSLLEETRSIKVKRLFFYFADRHQAQWLDRIDRAKIDLGKGKRMIAKGGKLDPKYQITVPEEMDALQ